MLITELARSKRKGFFDVFVDGEFSFSLTEDDIVKTKVRVGRNLTDQEFKALQEKSTYSYYFSRMLNFLSYRIRSQKELERKLDELFYKDKKNSEKELLAIKDKIFLKLKELKLLDDNLFALTYSKTKASARKPLGLTRIKSELYKKGINKEIIEYAVNKTEVADEPILKILIQKKLKPYKTISKQDLPSIKRKLASFLIRRGFAPSLVFSVVDTTIKSTYNVDDSEKTVYGTEND